MEKKLTRAEFAAALEAAGAKLKPQVAKDPALALRKMPAKARERMLAQLGVPGAAKVTARAEGDDVVLLAEAADRFADPAPAKQRGRFGLGRGKAAQEPQAAQAGAATADGDAGPAAPGLAAGAHGQPAAKKRLGFGRKGKAGPEPPPAAPPPELLLAPDGKGPAWKPDLTEHQREVDIYPVSPPFAWVRIVADDATHETMYNVLEPPLTEREQRVLSFLEDTLVDVLEIPLSALAGKKAAEVLMEHVNQIIYDYSILLDEAMKAKLMYYVQRDFLGFGIIDAIMRDDLIEDVSCDGPHVPIFLYHRKHESLKSNVQFVTHEALDAFVIRMAQRSGKHISIAEPLLDATLPDGSRLNATLSDEVTSAGSTYTIRKFRQTPFTPPDLVRFGTMSVDLLAYWWLAVQHGASAIYAGGTASGKTTSLNAILLFIPPTMKIVSIEDTRELNLPHPNWIPGITRSGFGPRDAHGRQAGEIDMFTLLKAALRQRPEYILVGEVRGAEAFTLFQAMATGHTAYGTMHADSVESVIHRLEGEPIKIPRSLLEALDVVSVQIQTRINGRRVRRTKELVEVVGLDPHTHEILTNTVFLWNSATDEFEYSGVSYVLENIAQERNWSPEQIREEWERRKDILRWLLQRDVRDFKAVAKVITAYFKEPDNVIAYVREDLARVAAEAQAAAAKAEAEAHAAQLAAAAAATPSAALLAEVLGDAAQQPGQLSQPGGEAIPTPQQALEATLPGVIEDAAAQAPEETEALAAAMAAASDGIRDLVLPRPGDPEGPAPDAAIEGDATAADPAPGAAQGTAGDAPWPQDSQPAEAAAGDAQGPQRPGERRKEPPA